MEKHDTDVRRRKFLTIATVGVGNVGIAATAIPFIESLAPSEAAKAAGAPVEVDISRLEPGMLVTVEWRGKPVWLLHRTEQMLDLLNKHNDQLVDPQSLASQQPVYAKNDTRSVRPEYLVVVGICTHLGCIPLYRPEVGAADLGPDWSGGFYCPCHGSKFDLAGRVVKNVPAPRNLDIPPHEYVSDTRLLIGKDSQSG